MLSFRKSFAALSLAAATALAGCASDHKPEGYNRERPDVTDLNSRDRGLQSSEVVEASEKLATELLSLPQVTESPRKLTVVFTHLYDLTRSRQFNYDIFLERLKTAMSSHGRDRIAFVTNRDKFYDTRNKELDPVRGERDDFGQGDGSRRGGDGAPAANRIQPDYALTGKVMELPNRGTDYYLFTFSLTDIRSNGGGTEIPLSYEVRVRR
jgi:hypothetical protein